MMRALSGFAVLALLIPIPDVRAQARKARPAAARVMTGVMRANEITARSADGRAGFTYTLKGAKLVDGRLHFTGSVARTGAAGREVEAQLVGTMARNSNPWPGPSQQRRVRKPTDSEARQPDEVTEQTQSLYAAREAGLGCEVLFLRMPLPGATAGGMAQVGVTLAPIDNPRGAKINEQLCRVVRALNAGQKSEVESQLSALNRLLAGGQ
ncbi:MAG TPA: hypothetical protein VNO70_12475 [Blastocatellia bacterium]|nr:hypothetical protein [Blastocatellia bacterium]